MGENPSAPLTENTLLRAHSQNLDVNICFQAEDIMEWKHFFSDINKINNTKTKLFKRERENCFQNSKLAKMNIRLFPLTNKYTLLHHILNLSHRQRYVFACSVWCMLQHIKLHDE